VSFTNDDRSCAVYGSLFELKQIKLLTKEARSRQAFDIRRLSLLSCTLGLDCEPHVLTNKLLKFFYKHAPNMEWLLITGPLLLENNDQACQIVNYLTTEKSRATQLQRLGLGLAPPANVQLATALTKLLQYPGSALNDLNLHGMSWKNKRALRSLGQGIAGSEALKSLDMSNCRITDEGLHGFVEALAASKTGIVALQSLTLRGNNLTSASLPDLAKLILACQGCLRSLDLSGMPELFQEATTERMDVFLRALEAATTTRAAMTGLQELFLSNTGMDSQVAKQILEQFSVSSSETETTTNTSSWSSLQRIDISQNSMPSRLLQELLADYLLRLPSSLKELSIVPSKALDDQPQQDGDDDDVSSERHSMAQLVETRNAVRQALHSNNHLTQLQIFDPKLLAQARGQHRHRQRTNQQRQEQESIPLMSPCFEGDDHVLNDSEWYDTQILPILERNALAERLAKSSPNEPPLAVWPQYLARTLSNTTSEGSSRNRHSSKSVAHSPTMVFQVLDRHLVSICTS